MASSCLRGRSISPPLTTNSRSLNLAPYYPIALRAVSPKERGEGDMLTVQAATNRQHPAQAFTLNVTRPRAVF